MARKPRKPKSKRGGRITWEDIKKRHGFQIKANLVLDWDRPFTEEEWQQVWDDYGDRITADYLQSNPGQRPYIWWKMAKNMEPPKGYGVQERPLREWGLLTDFEERKLAYLRKTEREDEGG